MNCLFFFENVNWDKENAPKSTLVRREKMPEASFVCADLFHPLHYLGAILLNIIGNAVF